MQYLGQTYAKKYYSLIWNSNFTEHSFFKNYIYVCLSVWVCTGVSAGAWGVQRKRIKSPGAGVTSDCEHPHADGCRVPTLDPLQERDASLTTEPSFAIAVSDSSSALGRDGSVLSPTGPRGRILGYLIVGECHLGDFLWELRWAGRGGKCKWGFAGVCPRSPGWMETDHGGIWSLLLSRSFSTPSEFRGRQFTGPNFLI